MHETFQVINISSIGIMQVNEDLEDTEHLAQSASVG